MRLTRIGVGSAAKISGALYAALGLIIGVFFALFALIGAGFAGMAAQDDNAPAFLSAMFGVGAVVLFPLFYGLLGLVGGAVCAAIYNLLARMIGGLEVEMEAEPMR